MKYNETWCYFQVAAAGLARSSSYIVFKLMFFETASVV